VLAPRDGDVHDPRGRCTRRAYRAVAHGKPNELDVAEPARLAEAVARMGLQYAVVTSVDRDDLADGGASIFADTIRLTRARVPDCRIEVLIPDFQGLESSLRVVLDAGPDVLNHNIETVPRLYRMARSGGRYPRSLELLDRSGVCPDIATKTGIMVGMGEEHEILTVRRPAPRGCVHPDDCSTCAVADARHDGAHYHPDEFIAQARGARQSFVHVEAGPLVRCPTTPTNKRTHPTRTPAPSAAYAQDFLVRQDLFLALSRHLFRTLSD
jgi:lipoic acid synthetase